MAAHTPDAPSSPVSPIKQRWRHPNAPRVLVSQRLSPSPLEACTSRSVGPSAQVPGPRSYREDGFLGKAAEAGSDQIGHLSDHTLTWQGPRLTGRLVQQAICQAARQNMKRSKAARWLLPVHLGGDLLCPVGAAGRFRCKYPIAQLPPSHGSQVSSARLEPQPDLLSFVGKATCLSASTDVAQREGGGIACSCLDKTL